MKQSEPAPGKMTKAEAISLAKAYLTENHWDYGAILRVFFVPRELYEEEKDCVNDAWVIHVIDIVGMSIPPLDPGPKDGPPYITVSVDCVTKGVSVLCIL
jgi:hypothetical protein